MSVTWARVQDKGEDLYVVCESEEKDGRIYSCKKYDPKKLCQNCQYCIGKVVDREVEK